LEQSSDETLAEEGACDIGEGKLHGRQDEVDLLEGGRNIKCRLRRIKSGCDCGIRVQEGPMARFIQPIPIGQPEQATPYLSNRPWKTARPHETNQEVSDMAERSGEGVSSQLMQEQWEGQRLWHGAIVEFGESEGSFAEFAVLLLGVREPFLQTFLVNKLDAAAAFARVVEGLGRRGLATAYTTVFLGIFIRRLSVSGVVRRGGPGIVEVERHVGGKGRVMPVGRRGMMKWVACR